jgi:hypothetical protein
MSAKRACSGCTTGRRRSLGVVAPNANDGLDSIEAFAARNDLGRRLEAAFDLELLEEAGRRVRRRAAPHSCES